MLKPKLKRRLLLLDDCIDALLRIECQFFACDGPFAPIVDMKTCYRCRIIHRAIQMGLVDGKTMIQFSVIDGTEI